jgi:FMN-dependent NADH-azoreductase
MSFLHISSSPRGTDSESLRIARVFTDAYAESHPDAEVEHWNLWDRPLPDMALGAKAKMTVFGGGTPVGAEGEVWAQARATFERFARPTGCCSACRCGTPGSRTSSSSSSTW